MPDELDLDTLDGDIERQNKTEKRIKDLSEKVRLTSEERDEKDELLAKERAEKDSLIKERDFLNSFADVSGKHPGASEYKDKIKAKVLSGYSVEDATISTLAAEGKFNPTPQSRQIPVESPVGGSAINQPQTSGDKSLSQMSQQEKREKIVELEKRGDIYVS